MTDEPMRLRQFGRRQHNPRQQLIIGASLAAVALLIAASITAGVVFGDDTTSTGTVASDSAPA